MCINATYLLYLYDLYFIEIPGCHSVYKLRLYSSFTKWHFRETNLDLILDYFLNFYALDAQLEEMLVHTYDHFWKSATETTFCKSHFVVDFCLMLCKSLWPHQIKGYYKSLSWHTMWMILSHWLQFLITNQGQLLGIAVHHMTHGTLNNFTPLLATNHHFLPPLWPHSRSTLQEKGDYASSHLCRWK